jgi:hypothetical protein
MWFMLLGMRVLLPGLRLLFRPGFLRWPYLGLWPGFWLWPLLRSRPYLRSRSFLRRWMRLLYRPLWLRSRPYLRGWTFHGSGMRLLYRPLWLWRWPYLRRWALLRSGPYLLNRPLLGRRCSHLLSRRWLRYRPFLHRPIDRGPGALHYWDRNRLTAFHGKRLGDYDRLRLATVYSNELGSVCTRLHPVLLLNG